VKFYFIHLEPITYIEEEQTEDDEQNIKRIMMRCTNLDESKNKLLIEFLFLIIFCFSANEESIIKMVTDDNEQERYLKIHSLVRDSYSPLGVILRKKKKNC